MLITRLELENFKSYDKETIAFQPNTTAIIGANGAGKSSLLEAIGFALFGQRSGALASRLREGSKSGSVAVTFISSLDERTYQVERCFNERTTTRYRVYDSELGGQILCEGAEEVQAWLRHHLKLDPGAQLDTLFESTVGVPQGTFTAPFLLPASQRKPIFDPLLQVEDYQKASDNLRATLRYLDDQMADRREKVAGLQGQLANRPGLADEREELEHKLAAIDGRLQALGAELASVRVLLQALDAAAARAREAELRYENARVALAAQERQLADARERWEEARSAHERVEAARPGHEAYLRAEDTLQVLQERRKQCDALQAQRARLAQELARLDAQDTQIQRELEAIAAAAGRMAMLQPLVARQIEFERALRAAEHDHERRLLLRERFEAVEAELGRARQVLATSEQGLKQAAELDGTTQRLQAQLDQVAQAILGEREQRAANGAEIERLQTQSEVLAQTLTARCPVCEAELSAEHRQELLQRNQQSIEALQAAQRACASTLAALERQEQELRRELARLRKQLQGLPDAQAVQQARAELERRQLAWTALQAELDALAGAETRLQASREALVRLGDPRREYQLHEDRLQHRGAVEREQAACATRRAELEAEQGALLQRLEAYASLDDEIAAAQRARADHSEAQHTFLSYERVAGQLSAHAGRMAQVQDELEALKEQLARLSAERQRAAEAYDPARHAHVQATASAANAALAAAQAQQSEWRARLETVARDLARLDALQSDLAACETELAELAELRARVELVRSVLRKAGPHITRQLVVQTGREASLLYGDIMDDHSGRLQWSEDYELTLEVKGLTRSFRQLSGGEQMSAALSLRLALLRQVSAVDIAFFDEPTANLDPDRRDGLAEKIMQVRGFSQVFVISHDDTFERAAQNDIRIVKDEGGSHWERD